MYVPFKKSFEVAITFTVSIRMTKFVVGPLSESTWSPWLLVNHINAAPLGVYSRE
jgi:hypothetical protein